MIGGLRSSVTEDQRESQPPPSDVKENVTLDDWCLLQLGCAKSNEDIAESADKPLGESEASNKDAAECVTSNPAESVTADPAESVTSDPAGSVTSDPAESETSNPAESVTSYPAGRRVKPSEDSAESANSNEDTETNDSSVDRCIIKIPDLLTNTKMSKVYNVNGTTFVEDENLSSHDDDSIVRYELYKVKKMMENDEDGSDDEDMISELDIQTQTLTQGLVINSNVFLTDTQWHTMCRLHENLFYCAVCESYCDGANCKDHVQLASHLRNLDRYRPLRRFDLSIVRKINIILHCGVCNEVFDIIDSKKHENSKPHEGNLLTAINKVSDLTFDSNTNQNVYDRNTQSTGNDTDRNMVSSRTVVSFDSNTLTPDREYRNNNQFEFNANDIGNISVYEYSDNEDDEEYTYEGEEYNTPCQGISYASMASKPRINQPKFLKIDLGTKEVRVKFESWHMIIKPELNQFYCMVCNKREHIRFKSQHCMSCDHVDRLARCTIVGAFEDYLIRKVDDKLYHCGHCNNLQYQNQMSDHIESAHPRKNKNIIDTPNNPPVNSPLKNKKPTKVNTDKSNMNKIVPEPFIKTESEKIAIVNKSLEYKIEKKIDPNFDIFGDLTLSPFGSELRISALAFNIIMKRDDEYYCAICDKICADVRAHVVDLDHMEMMNMTPFIRPFKSNLTRAVRGTLHCSLCNELILVRDIRDHNIDPQHTTALAVALGMKKTQKPDSTKKNYFISSDLNMATSGPSLQLPFAIPNQPLKIETSSLNNLQATTNLSKILKISENSSNRSSPLPSPNLSTVGKNGVAKNSANISPGQNGSSGFSFNAGKNQNLPTAGQNIQAGQNAPFPGQTTLFPGQNALFPGQNAPFSGQNINGNQPLFPPMYAPLPFLPSLNSQNNGPHLGAPLMYTNFNATVAPYPYVQPHHNYPTNFATANISNKPKTTEQQKIIELKTENTPTSEVQKKLPRVRKTSEKTPPNKSYSANGTVKTAKDNTKSVDNIESADINIKPESDITESLNISTEEEKEFDEEEFVFVKFKNMHTAYFKINYLSYNSLVYVDNGIKYCFVCSNTVPTSALQKHVDSREHTENVAKNMFLDKYGAQLFRQMYLMFHCSICNVLMTRKEIKMHLDWPEHIRCYDAAREIRNKKYKKELKSGIKEYLVETQKEAIFHNVNEPKINIIGAYQFVPNLEVETVVPEATPTKGSKPTVVKKKKMVILNNVVMKISFGHWHGITCSKNVTKCVICQMEIRPDEVTEHVATAYHNVALGKTFEKTFYPALIRKVNEFTVNCMMCNLELPNNESMIHEHVNGRKHNKNRNNIINESSNSDSYTDCYEEYLNLT